MLNESEWPARVSAWRASGKSAPEFCADKDYSATTLYWWASRLKREGQPRVRRKSTSLRLARVVRTPPDETPNQAPIVLQVGPARLEIGRGADPATLSHVLAALSETRWGGRR